MKRRVLVLCADFGITLWGTKGASVHLRSMTRALAAAGLDVAVAAHHVLAVMYPAHKSALDAALERSLAAVPDRQEKSNVRIWGRELGGVVHTGMRPGDGAAALAPKPPQGMARLAALNAMVAASLDTRELEPIERARVHALASLAVSEAYAATGTQPAGRARAAAAAALAVLEAELVAGEAAGRRIGRQARAVYPAR